MTESTDQQIAALRRELTIVWDSHEREHKQHEISHAREHEFAQVAIEKAALLAKENKSDANEWRASMNDREAKFATKDDVKAILGRLDGIERAGLVAAERDRQRLIAEAEEKQAAVIRDAKEKQAADERTRASQWRVGIVIGVLVTAGTILVNFALRSV